MGSYWVFIDSITGTRDSLLVVGYNADQQFMSGSVSYTDINIHILDYNDSVIAPKYWEIELLSVQHSAILVYYNQGYINDGTQLLSYNIDPFNIVFGNTVLSQINVGAKSYANVLSSALGNDRILLNADSGFVKMTLNNQYTQKVLLLQKSHIVR